MLAFLFFLAGTSALGEQPQSKLTSGDSAPNAEEIFAAWRARQARSTTVHCKVEALTHYSPGSQFVAGASQLLPTHGRSAKHSASLQFAGPGQFSFHHQGLIWHRLFGQLLPMDWVRLSDGNLYMARQLGYECIPGWRPKAKGSDRYSSDPQQRGWDDELLTPIIQHYRPFNSRLCPFEKPEQWTVKKSALIDGRTCFLLARNQPKLRVAIRDYQYWVAPSLQMSVVRLQCLTNGWVETQFDVQFTEGDLGPEPNGYHMKRFYQSRLLEFAKVAVTKLDTNQPIADTVFQIPDEAGKQ